MAWRSIGGKQTDISNMKVTILPQGYIHPEYKKRTFNNEDTAPEATERRKEARKQGGKEAGRRGHKPKHTEEEQKAIANEKLSIIKTAEKYNIVESTVSRYRKKWRGK